VLNDIGPVIEPRGLLRIQAYLRPRPAPATWDIAATAIQRLYAPSFPALSPADFARMAGRTWREDPSGRLEPVCDPALLQTLSGLNFEQPLPPLWDLFDALAKVPLMTIRGALSDILSVETLAEMRRRRPDMAAFETPGQGHAPLLADAPTQEAISAFLGSAEG
jgi:hypothetical protein